MGVARTSWFGSIELAGSSLRDARRAAKHQFADRSTIASSVTITSIGMSWRSGYIVAMAHRASNGHVDLTLQNPALRNPEPPVDQIDELMRIVAEATDKEISPPAGGVSAA